MQNSTCGSGNGDGAHATTSINTITQPLLDDTPQHHDTNRHDNETIHDTIHEGDAEIGGTTRAPRATPSTLPSKYSTASTSTSFKARSPSDILQPSAPTNPQKSAKKSTSSGTLQSPRDREKSPKIGGRESVGSGSTTSKRRACYTITAVTTAPPPIGTDPTIAKETATSGDVFDANGNKSSSSDVDAIFKDMPF